MHSLLKQTKPFNPTRTMNKTNQANPNFPIDANVFLINKRRNTLALLHQQTQTTKRQTPSSQSDRADDEEPDHGTGAKKRREPMGSRFHPVPRQGGNLDGGITGSAQAYRPGCHQITPSGFQSGFPLDFTAGRREIWGVNPPIRAG